MTMLMGRWVGMLVTLHAVTACYDRSDHNDGSVSGLTNATNNPGAGGSTTQGPGGTTTQGQGGTTTTTTTQGQGGAAGDAGSPGAGGDPGFAGAAGHPGFAGGSGDTSSCEGHCEPCEEGLVFADACDADCVCEPADSPDKPVIEELLACDLDEPCPPSVRYDDPGTATWDNGACLLAAFRDRTRGSFHHQTTLADIGSYTTDYTFLLGDDDEVLVLRTTTNDAGPGNLERTYYPVWSCTLRSYAELDDCVAAGT